MAYLFTRSKFQSFDANGNPLAGGKVYTYEAGTTTPKATYTNQGGGTANANPVILDANGCAKIWLGSGSYKFVVTDSADVAAPDGTEDNISSAASAADIASVASGSLGGGQVGYGYALTTYEDETAAGAINIHGVAVPDGGSIATALVVVASGGTVRLGPYSYTGNISIPANVTVIGVPGKTRIVAPAATTSNTVTFAGNGATIRDVVIDCSAAGAAVNGIFSSGRTGCRVEGVKVESPTAHGLWAYNSPDLIVRDLWVDDATDWGVLIDGASSLRVYGDNIKCTNCANRGLMVRLAKDSQFFGVTGQGNYGTAAWIQDCEYVHIVGVFDRDDEIGDTAVIEGASIGCTITNVIAKDCGGHCASISSYNNGVTDVAPVNCHIGDVYSEGQGESIAAITDQGTGAQPAFCTITGVKGRDCGRVSPYEGFGISNAINCKIQGSIYSSSNDMNYAVLEGGASPSQNVFEIDSWVTGATGYFAISSSTSTIVFPRLEGRMEHYGDANASWVPSTSGTNLMYDLATLTAERTVTLANGWPGMEILVSRSSAGAFNLLVKNAGGTTLKTLAASKQCRLVYDSNWTVMASGDV